MTEASAQQAPAGEDPSRTALVAAARRALEPIASELVRPLLASLHATAPGGGGRIGLVVLRSEIDESLAWALLAAEVAGAWAVYQACELHPEAGGPAGHANLAGNWLPYGDRSPLGALIACGRNDEGVESLRAAQVAADCLAAHPGLLLALTWDAEKPDLHAWLRPRQIELLRGEPPTWEPAAELPRHLVSREGFVAAYRRHARATHQKDPDFWAWGALLETWDARDKLPLVRLLVEAATLDELELLGGLGAGRLEDMASDWLLDELGPAALADRRWLYALAMVRDFSAGGPLTDRFSRMLTLDMRQWLQSMGLSGWLP